MNPANPYTRAAWQETRAGAERLHLRPVPVEARAVDELERAFAAMRKARPDALLVLGDRPILLSHRAQIVGYAARQRLPAIYLFREYVADGGLAALGPDFVESFRHAASYIDKILKGAAPGDLPIERPTKFELVLNLRSAKALGLAIPAPLLQRAQLIE